VGNAVGLGGIRGGGVAARDSYPKETTDREGPSMELACRELGVHRTMVCGTKDEAESLGLTGDHPVA
jgi:hypothetical protein